MKKFFDKYFPRSGSLSVHSIPWDIILNLHILKLVTQWVKKIPRTLFWKCRKCSCTVFILYTFFRRRLQKRVWVSGPSKIRRIGKIEMFFGIGNENTRCWFCSLPDRKALSKITEYRPGPAPRKRPNNSAVFETKKILSPNRPPSILPKIMLHKIFCLIFCLRDMRLCIPKMRL